MVSASTPSVEAPVAEGVLGRQLRSTTVGVMIAITMLAFEAMAVATALPSAARSLDGLGSYGWLFTGFLVANMVGMVVGGGWSDQRGPRTPLVLGLVGFVTGLVVAGTAPLIAVLVLARAVQGLSAGLLFIALYVVIGQRYPRQLQPRMMAAVSAAWVLPSLVGPIVAGTLAETVGWRWVFWGIVPFVLIGSVLLLPTLRGLTPTPRTAAPAVRRRLVLALVIAAGVAVFQEAGHVSTRLAVPTAVAGVVVVVAGLAGLLPAGWWRLAPGVSGPVAVRGLFAAAFFGVDALVPLTLQDQHGFGPLAAGLPLTCGAVTWALGSWIQGRDRWSERQRVQLMRLGLALIGVAALLMAVVAQPSAWPWIALLAWTVGGTGAGLGMTAVSVLLLRFTVDAERGRDSSSMQLCDAVGAALATGFGGIMVALVTRGALSRTTAFTVVDVTMAGVAVVGAVGAGRVRAAR